MRLSLNKEAAVQLERVQTICKESNSHIEPVPSTFLFKVLKALEQVLSREQWREVASQATSERIKRKLIVERLLKLGEKLDESDIDKFEAKIERKQAASNTEFPQKSAEIS